MKILDFGSAMALDTAPDGDPSQSPTLTAAARQRVQAVGDVRLAMEGAFETTVSALPGDPSVHQTSDFRQTLRLTVGALIVGGLITGVAVFSLMGTGSNESSAATRFTLPMPDAFGRDERVQRLVLAANIVSPGGRTIVFLAGNQLYRRELGQSASHADPGD